MLKYLFEAEFADGSVLKQDQKDVSSLDPKRNQFYDVLHSEKECIKLTFIEQTIWNPTVISVDLQTGNFTLNGIELYMQPVVNKKGKQVVNLKRKPFRNMDVWQHSIATYNTKTLKVLGVGKTTEERIFNIGWIAEVDGKEIKQVIGIK